MWKQAARSAGRRLFRLADSPAKLRRLAEPWFWLLGFRSLGQDSKEPRRIAIVKLDRLGDLALAAPVLEGARRLWPSSRITLLVREPLVEFARSSPHVDEVIGLPVTEGAMIYDASCGAYLGWSGQLRTWLRCCHQKGLWKRRFDWALVPRWETDFYGSVPLAFLTGARRRWGVTEKAGRLKEQNNLEFDRLLTDIVSGECRKHEMLLNLDFVEALGGAAFGKSPAWVSEEKKGQALELLRKAGIAPDKPFIALCLGAGSPHKMWPADRYAAMCREAFNLDTVQCATFGAPHEQYLGASFQEALGSSVIHLEGRLPIDLVASALSFCAVYVGSDTGAKHLAAAAGRPVFEISCHPRSGDPHWGESRLRFGPWGVANRVVQPDSPVKPCSQYCAAREAHCILGVSVAQAAAELRSFLHEIGLGHLGRD